VTKCHHSQCSSLPGQRVSGVLLTLPLWHNCCAHYATLHFYRACGAYTFNPGGAAVNAKWSGPVFELTQTTGSCTVEPSFNGAGNTRWTRLQGRLACAGPTTQYSWVSEVQQATLFGNTAQRHLPVMLRCSCLTSCFGNEGTADHLVEALLCASCSMYCARGIIRRPATLAVMSCLQYP
jgi:hypothetical protein